MTIYFYEAKSKARKKRELKARKKKGLELRCLQVRPAGKVQFTDTEVRAVVAKAADMLSSIGTVRVGSNDHFVDRLKHKGKKRGLPPPLQPAEVLKFFDQASKRVRWSSVMGKVRSLKPEQEYTVVVYDEASRIKVIILFTRVEWPKPGVKLPSIASLCSIVRTRDPRIGLRGHEDIFRFCGSESLQRTSLAVLEGW